MNKVPLELEAAQRIILETVRPVDVERIPHLASFGRILAEDVIASDDVPRWDRSMMDGYAVRSADVAGATPGVPIALDVVDSIPAGSVPRAPVGPGQAARIMTGAMIPAGADAVVRLEATRFAAAEPGATRPGKAEPAGQPDTPRRSSLPLPSSPVHVLMPVRPSENIARQGEDIRHGTTVLRAGCPIGPGEAAVLATFGVADVLVHRRPVVGILATGSELVEPHETPGPGQLRNSNGAMLAALVAQAGGLPKLLRPVSDDVAAIAREIRSALPGVDLLVTTGGVSVGDYDLVPDVLADLGAETLFWRVLIRPGSPFRFAILNGGIPLFGVSGNPAACFVNTQLFVLPALHKVSGRPHPSCEPAYASAELADCPELQPVKHARFLRATALLKAGRLVVHTAHGQSSGMIGSLVGANCLARIDGGSRPAAGQTVRILLYDEIKIAPGDS